MLDGRPASFPLCAPLFPPRLPPQLLTVEEGGSPHPAQCRPQQCENGLPPVGGLEHCLRGSKGGVGFKVKSQWPPGQP